MADLVDKVKAWSGAWMANDAAKMRELGAADVKVTRRDGNTSDGIDAVIAGMEAMHAKAGPPKAESSNHVATGPDTVTWDSKVTTPDGAEMVSASVMTFNGDGKVQTMTMSPK